MAGANCRVCETRPAVMHGRCRCCDAYWRRTGKERPEEVVVAYGHRRMVQRQEAEIMLRYLSEARELAEGA